jgi:signal transduction histidine kinase
VTGAVAAAAGWTVTATVLMWVWQLRRMLDRQREAAARAAHELRGPLTSIGLALEFEASGTVGVAGHAASAWDHRRAVGVELARANLALDDLAGLRWGVRLTPAVGSRPVDVATVLDDSVCGAAACAVAAGIEVIGEWRGAPATVYGDGARLAQALGNLIANAIEHGGGRVEVLGHAAEHAVRIEVRDCGPGLPAPVPELVRSARGGRGQRGRGLAIAASIAAQHRGRLTAAPCSRGARLVLELPTESAPRMGGG